MSERDALLRRIIDEPDADAPRLVFADWCEENGEPDRAEFIRAQIQLEGMPEWEPERFDLEERSLDLLSAHWDEWTADLPAWARQQPLTFRRGFVGEARMKAIRFRDSGDELVEAAPLLRGTLSGLGKRPEALARSQALLGLREVVFDLDYRDRPHASPFFRDWRPRRLVHLGLAGASWYGDDEIAALLELPHWRELRRLDLRAPVGDGSVAAACRLGGLVALDFQADLSAWSAMEVAGAGWRRLERLGIHGHYRPYEYRPVEGDMGQYQFGAITEADWFPRLRSLTISGASFDACAALSDVPAGLRHLAVSDSPEGDGGLDRLLESDLVAGLASFRLYGAASTQSMAGLAAAPRLSGLRRLSASPRSDDAGIPIDLLCDVLESRHLTRLTRLHLATEILAPADAARLAALSGLSRLRALELTGCLLSEDGMRALARSPHVAGLRRLEVHSSSRGGPCLRALLEAPWLASLRELKLICEGIGDDDLETLAGNPAVSRLRSLHLGPQPITRKGTEALANSPHLGGLLYLNVGNHDVGDDLSEPLRERFGGRFVGCF
jgi:uncharacterized protein (TIGR02996 family)